MLIFETTSFHYENVIISKMVRAYMRGILYDSKDSWAIRQIWILVQLNLLKTLVSGMTHL